MTWEILSALIVIVGCLVTLGGVLGRLTRTLTKLDCTLQNMKKELTAYKADNSTSHKRIYEHLEDHDKQLENHEMRIHDLERR